MSAVDLTQFHTTFFDESREAIDAMEAALLALHYGDRDPELVHTIFRAAHSIKGGSATFGFSDVANFTHVLESLLEEVRAERRGIDGQLIELMLRSVDCLRVMMARAAAGQSTGDTESEALRAELGCLAMDKADLELSNDAVVVSNGGWNIHFSAMPHLLQTGNDPLRLLRELQLLGTVEVCRVYLLDSAPLRLAELDPSQCFLGWHLRLRGSPARSAVVAVFDWLDGDCELSITALEVPPNIDPPTESVDPSFAGPPRNLQTESREGTSIRVGIDKVDALINMMGELVITQAMLGNIGENFQPVDLQRLREGLLQLERNTRELQDSVMRIRMLPISSVFNRFPRLVHDLERRLDKRVHLKLLGEHTELDKTVLEKIGDPLLHLVRNAIDHGLESPARRRAAGKPEIGTLTLKAYHDGGTVVLQISDDGAGLDRAAIVRKAVQGGLAQRGAELTDADVAELIFQPGFSTADTASDLSGRGVGMDVVRRNVRDLGGTVRVHSVSDIGSTFTIVLPLTLAIIDGLVTTVGHERYIIPLTSIVESLRLTPVQVRPIPGGGEVFHFREQYLPLLRLYRAFDCPAGITDVECAIVVVIEEGGQRMGLLVDALLGQQQAVVKSLDAHYQRVQGISGATILSDGSVALIVDVGGVVRLARRSKAA